MYYATKIWPSQTRKDKHKLMQYHIDLLDNNQIFSFLKTPHGFLLLSPQTYGSLLHYSHTIRIIFLSQKHIVNKFQEGFKVWVVDRGYCIRRKGWYLFVIRLGFWVLFRVPFFCIRSSSRYHINLALFSPHLIIDIIFYFVLFEPAKNGHTLYDMNLT